MKTSLMRRRLGSTFNSTNEKSVYATHKLQKLSNLLVDFFNVISTLNYINLSISTQHQELYLILDAIDNISHLCKNSLKKLNHDKSTKPAFAKLKQIEVKDILLADRGL